MNRALKMLLRTGLNMLEQSDRATEPVREHIADTADLLRRKIRGEDHTLRYVLSFAAGVGVGVGVGILTAPGSGAQNRNSISEKIREVGNRIKTQVAQRETLPLGVAGKANDGRAPSKFALTLTATLYTMPQSQPALSAFPTFRLRVCLHWGSFSRETFSAEEEWQFASQLEFVVSAPL